MACAAIGVPTAVEARPAVEQFASASKELVPLAKLPGRELEQRYVRLHRKVLRKRAGKPGRNIVVDGVKARGDVRHATRAEVRRSVRVLRRMLAATDGGGGGAASPQLEAIAACESGGDPTAIGGGGAYRGKYQFDPGTWASVGGSGDPAAAPEAEQDKRAAMLLARDGAGHWPNC